MVIMYVLCEEGSVLYIYTECAKSMYFTCVDSWCVFQNAVFPKCTYNFSHICYQTKAL